jgi:hypothetical protein
LARRGVCARNRPPSKTLQPSVTHAGVARRPFQPFSLDCCYTAAAVGVT